MTVQEVIKQLIELPMDAELVVATTRDEMRNIIGVILEGPFGIFKPHLAYIEMGEVI